MPRGGPILNLAGLQFGRLVVIELVPNSSPAKWKCLCECGQLSFVRSTNLVQKNTKSCGCLERDARLRAGGMSRTRVYNIWRGMLRRCYDKAHTSYKHYGGRGIQVCLHWHSLENFHLDMGDPPEGKVLERVDNNLGYFKENCKWATWEEQAKNRRKR